MSIFGLLLIIYLIGRYLQASNNSSCENAGRQMTDDVEDICDSFWRILDGCITWGFLGLGVILLLIWITGVVGKLL